MAVPVIIGAGLAGLSAALALAPKPVVVLGRPSAMAMTSSEMAQGGIAAAAGPDDSLRLHEQDTLAAGAGLCDPRVVRSIIGEGPRAIERLAIWGVGFDRDALGNYNLGLEGAHVRRRVVHANGDATGAAVMKALLMRVRATPSITMIEDSIATEITADARGVTGVTFINPKGRVRKHIKTNQVILATGSACALWRHTTVPHGSWGHGLWLAAQVGARLRDLEFVQFHPTALDIGIDPMPLISEALRGEGARLLNEKGEQFVGELNPRDIVARAIWAETERGHKVCLDARTIQNFEGHFPTILEACLKGGINPRETMIPICPVAHYHMGGVATDINGKTNIAGLRACGEVACTGLHGANRLASNSLLEAVVMGCRVAEDIRPHISLHEQAEFLSLQTVEDRFELSEDVARVRALMMAHVGLRRTQTGLERAVQGLEPLASRSLHAQVGLMITRAALERRESRGAHDRKDFPSLDPDQAVSRHIVLHDGQSVVEKG